MAINQTNKKVCKIMSVKLNVSFYFKLDPSLSRDVVLYYIHKCENEACKSPVTKKSYEQKASDFCCGCGTKLVSITGKIEKCFPSCYDFCEKHLNNEEIVATDNGGLPDNVWIYNYFLQDDDLKKLVNDGESMYQSDLDLSSLDISESIEKFKQIEEVKLFLNKFEEVYGKDMIKVCYGAYSVYY